MKASRRNIVIAVVLLAVLLVLPFWPKIRQALAPAAVEEVSCTVTVACQAEALRSSGRQGLRWRRMGPCSPLPVR